MKLRDYQSDILTQLAATRAPRENMDAHGHAKNLAAITDILGSFDVRSVIDPFAGIGTVGIAAAELDMDCVLIERNPEHVKTAQKLLRFVGHNFAIEEGIE